MKLRYKNGAVMDVPEEKAERLLQSSDWKKAAAPRKAKPEPEPETAPPAEAED